MSFMDQMNTNKTKSTSTNKASYTIANKQYGWICPVCGRGNAPWNSSCSCRGGYWAYPSYPWWNQPWYVTCNDTAGPSSIMTTTSTTDTIIKE